MPVQINNVNKTAKTAQIVVTVDISNALIGLKQWIEGGMPDARANSLFAAAILRAAAVDIRASVAAAESADRMNQNIEQRRAALAAEESEHNARVAALPSMSSHVNDVKTEVEAEKAAKAAEKAK